MALVTAHLATPEDAPRCRQRQRPALVIADSGVAASLVILDDSTLPSVGLRFRHAGATWKISGWRSSARAFVAEPVEH
jgi:hypothetical protein